MTAKLIDLLNPRKEWDLSSIVDGRVGGVLTLGRDGAGSDIEVGDEIKMRITKRLRNSDQREQIPEATISRKHLEIKYQYDPEEDKGIFYVRDCGSTNGTNIMGIKITDWVPVRSGTIIRAGTYPLMLEYES